MPISWRIQFTFPVLAQMIAGRVKDPISFAGVISQQYDLAIKAGFPLPPAPPVPFTLGKKSLLKTAIIVGFGLELFSLLKRLLAVNKKSSSKHLAKLNTEIANNIQQLTSELNTVLKGYNSDVKDIVDNLDSGNIQFQFLDNTSTTAGQQSTSMTQGIAQFVKIDVGDPCKNYIVPLQTVSTPTFNDWKNGTSPPDIGIIKSSVLDTYNLNTALVNDFSKLLAQFTISEKDYQEARQKETKLLSKNSHNLIKIFSRQKPSIFTILKMVSRIIKGIIAALLLPVTQKIKVISDITSKLSSLNASSLGDIAIQKNMLKGLLSLEKDDLKKYKKMLSGMPKIVIKPFKLNPFKVLKGPDIDFKKRIKEVDLYIAKEMNISAAKEANIRNKKKSVVNNQSKLNEIKASLSAAEVQFSTNIISTTGTDTQKLQTFKNILTDIFTCTMSITNEEKNKILNSPNLLEKLTAHELNDFIDKFSDINNNAVASLDDDISDEKARKKSFQSLLKQNRNAEKLWDLKKPQRLFDIALGVGLLAYWVAGTIPSPAGVTTVILPGLPPVALGLKTNFTGPLKFFGSLEAIFQAHSFAIAGLFQPAASVPPLPWVGYI